MNNIDTKNHIYSINPYQSFWSDFKEGIASYTSRIFSSSLSKDDPILSFADKIGDLGRRILFKDYEKQVDFTGKVARILDWSVFLGSITLEGFVIVNNLLHLHLFSKKVLQYIPYIGKLATIPTSSFFFAMGVIEGSVELVNIKRVTRFYKQIELKKDDPQAQLNWIKEKYFTLSPGQVQKIQTFIKVAMPHMSQAQKAKRFTQIAEKVLKNQLQALGRRISSGLANEVHKNLQSILSDLQSWSPHRRAKAQEKARILMESVSEQAKNKILIHVLGLMTIACTIISLIAVFTGVSTTAIFTLLASGAIFLIAAQIFVRKTTVDRELDTFYANWEKLSQSVKG